MTTTVDAAICIVKADKIRAAMRLLDQSHRTLPHPTGNAFLGEYTRMLNSLNDEALNLEAMAQQARQPQVEG